MGRPAYRYNQSSLEYVQENAGKIKIEDIAAHLGVTILAVKKQSELWRSKGHIVPSLKKSDSLGTIKQKRHKSRGLMLRIKTDKGWEALSRHNYEKHIGSIPEGYNIKFKDGDAMNCEPENLELISVSEQFSLIAKRQRKPPVIKTIKTRIAMPRTVKPPTRGTTSQKKKPGTDANWTQRHLVEDKAITILSHRKDKA